MIGKSVNLKEFEDYLGGLVPHRKIDRVIVHHFWRPKAADWRGVSTLQGVCDYHVKVKKWNDIGYHVVVGPDGSIWLARPIEQAGAHTVGQNGRSIGVAYAADFDTEDPKLNGYQTGVEVCAAIVKRFDCDECDIFFHRNFSPKSCPGKKMDLEEFRRDVARALENVNEDGFVRLKIDDRLVPNTCITIDGSGRANGRKGPIAAALGHNCDDPDKIVPVRDYLSTLGVIIPEKGWHPEQGPHGTIYAYTRDGELQ